MKQLQFFELPVTVSQPLPVVPRDSSRIKTIGTANPSSAGLQISPNSL